MNQVQNLRRRASQSKALRFPFEMRRSPKPLQASFGTSCFINLWEVNFESSSKFAPCASQSIALRFPTKTPLVLLIRKRTDKTTDNLIYSTALYSLTGAGNKTPVFVPYIIAPNFPLISPLFYAVFLRKTAADTARCKAAWQQARS